MWRDIDFAYIAPMRATYVRNSSNPPSNTNPGAGVTPAGCRRRRGRPARSAVTLGVRGASETGNGAAKGARGLVDALLNCKVDQEYARAYAEATGLPLALSAPESWQLPHHGRRNEGPFCALVSHASRACAYCLSVQEKLSRIAAQQSQTVSCPNGLCETAVPVRSGDRAVAYLLTGQVFRHPPTRKQFEAAVRQVRHWGISVSRKALREAYFASAVIPPKRHAAMIGLLEIFAQHLALLGNQLLVQQQNAEPPVITHAKDYILEHQGENLRLSQVAKACNTSTFYFCKMFKRNTGLNFTDYLSRVRIEKSKGLLLNPNLRVSEIAFEVGFQSLTHYNRVFKKLLGLSPSGYRAQLAGYR